MNRLASTIARAFAVCFAAAIAMLPIVTMASNPPTWSEPVQIGAEIPSSWFPDLSVDPAGDFRLVWSGTLVTGDANLSDALNGAVMISELSDDVWTEPSDIVVMDGGIASRPMIASDGQYAHLIYRISDPGDPVRLVYSRAALTSDLDDSADWSPPFILSSDEAYWAQIVVLPDDGLLVVYNKETAIDVNGTPERRTGIFARRSSDQGATWSDEQRIAETVDRVARISLSVAPGSTSVVLAWDEGYDNMTAQGVPTAIVTMVSDDGGITWANLNRFKEQAEQSAVATDGTTTMLVYRSTTENVLAYRTSDDGGRTWSDRLLVPNAVTRPYGGPHNFDKLSLAFDGDGRLLLAWVGADESAPNGLSVMVATYADSTWTEPRAIVSPVGFPEYPRIAVGLGNQIQIAYFVRDKEFDIGSYTLWAISGTSDAAPIAPQAFAPVYQDARIAPTPAPVTIEQAPVAPAAAGPVGAIPRGGVSPQATLTAPLRPVILVTLAALIIAAALRVLVRMTRGYRF